MSGFALADRSTKVRNNQPEKIWWAKEKGNAMYCTQKIQTVCLLVVNCRWSGGCLHSYTSFLPLIWLLDYLKKIFFKCKEVLWRDSEYFPAQIYLLLHFCPTPHPPTYVCTSMQLCAEMEDLLIKDLIVNFLMSVFWCILLTCAFIPFQCSQYFSWEGIGKKKVISVIWLSQLSTKRLA